MHSSAAMLTEKIQALRPEQVVEVEDFIEFLRLRDRERSLTHSAAAASRAAFETVWANSEDEVYDAL